MYRFSMDTSGGGKPAVCHWTVSRSRHDELDVSIAGKPAVCHWTGSRSGHEELDMSNGGKPAYNCTMSMHVDMMGWAWAMMESSVWDCTWGGQTWVMVENLLSVTGQCSGLDMSRQTWVMVENLLCITGQCSDRDMRGQIWVMVENLFKLASAQVWKILTLGGRHE